MVKTILIVLVIIAIFDLLLLKGGTYKEKMLEENYETTKEADS